MRRQDKLKLVLMALNFASLRFAARSLSIDWIAIETTESYPWQKNPQTHAEFTAKGYLLFSMKDKSI